MNPRDRGLCVWLLRGSNYQGDTVYTVIDQISLYYSSTCQHYIEFECLSYYHLDRHTQQHRGRLQYSHHHCNTILADIHYTDWNHITLERTSKYRMDSWALTRPASQRDNKTRWDRGKIVKR